MAEIEFSGRGQARLVRYVFGPPPAGEDPELAELLSRRGVKQGVAVRLSTVFPERLAEAARRFDHYLNVSARPVANPGGLLVAMVQRPEDFTDLPGYPAPAPTDPAPAARSTRSRSAEKVAAAADESLTRWRLPGWRPSAARSWWTGCCVS